MNYQIFTTSNGLRVAMIPKHDTGIITVMLGIGVGSRDEPENLAGLSHFVEHMAYKGTKKRPTSKTVAEFFDNFGGVTNAITGKEFTVYYAKSTSKYLPKILDYLADNVINSVNSDSEIESEKKVILEDINMHKDRPMEEVAEIFESAVFPIETLGKRIIGTPETVANISEKDIIEHKKKYYVSDNAIVVIIGDYSEFSGEQILKIVDQNFQFRRGKKNYRNQSGFKCKSIYKSQLRETKQSNLIVGFPTHGLASDEWTALKLLSKILGGSMSSRMYREIREKHGLAYAITSGYLGYSDFGALYTQAGISNDSINKSINSMICEYKKIVQRKIELSELARAKEIISNGILINNEGSEALARQILSMEFQQNKIINDEELIAMYRSVSKKDVTKVAEKYIDFDKLVVSLVGPNLQDFDLEQTMSRIKKANKQ